MSYLCIMLRILVPMQILLVHITGSACNNVLFGFLEAARKALIVSLFKTLDQGAAPLTIRYIFAIINRLSQL